MNQRHPHQATEELATRPSDAMVTQESPHAMALAQRETAVVQARYALARNFPRSVDLFRSRLLKECSRPSFAEVARYSVPRGGKNIEGPSIRFAEAAFRLFGNLEIEEIPLSEDATSRVFAIRGTDQETNASVSQTFTVPKTVERKQLRAGQRPIDTRTNSYGETVFLVPASDDEQAVKHAALRSKAYRTVILRLLPGDVIDEAESRAIATMRDRDAKDPDEARRRMTDAFFSVGITATMLVEYLGGAPLEGIQPDQLGALRLVFAAIRDGESTWADALAASPYIRRDKPAAAEGGPGPVDDKAAALRERMAAARQQAGSKAAPAKPPSNPGASGGGEL